MRLQAFCALMTLALAVLAAGCNPLCPRYKCVDPPGLEVEVTDADTGAALSQARVDAVVNGVATPMSEPCTTTVATSCRASSVRGPIEVVVRADGYEEARFAVNIDEDHCGHAVSQHRDVALQRLGASRQALTSERPGAPSCGQE